MSGPSSTVQLHFKCSDLPRKDLLSKSDPFVVVYLFDAEVNKFMEVRIRASLDQHALPHSLTHSLTPSLPHSLTPSLTHDTHIPPPFFSFFFFLSLPRCSLSSQFGRSEVIKDNHNPSFMYSPTIEYFFEITQRLRFEVYVPSPCLRVPPCLPMIVSTRHNPGLPSDDAPLVCGFAPLLQV